MLEKYQTLISSTILGSFILISAVIISQKPNSFESCQELFGKNNDRFNKEWCSYKGIVSQLKEEPDYSR